MCVWWRFKTLKGMFPLSVGVDFNIAEHLVDHTPPASLSNDSAWPDWACRSLGGFCVVERAVFKRYALILAFVVFSAKNDAIKTATLPIIPVGPIRLTPVFDDTCHNWKFGRCHQRPPVQQRDCNTGQAVYKKYTPPTKKHGNVLADYGKQSD